MIVGSRVRLRPAAADDLPHFLRWFNDPDVIAFLDFHPPVTEAVERTWLEGLPSRSDVRVFVIESLWDGQPIGTIGLSAITPQDRHAEIGLTIGEKGEWGKGYGTDAVRTMLDFAFGTLELRKVSLRVHADHAAAIRLYERCGFTRERWFQAETARRGTLVDEYVMAIQRSEWQPPVRAVRAGRSV